MVLIVAASLQFASLRAEEMAGPDLVPVAYPEGYRDWKHVSSVMLPPKSDAMKTEPSEPKPVAPHGLLFNIYANDKALEGYRTGHFPEGAVLIADWFVLEQKGPTLVQGSRKSVNVMVRDARYINTGGWGFEDFDRDSRTIRNVGANAVKSCFECHSHAKEHEFVFSGLKP